MLVNGFRESSADGVVIRVPSLKARKVLPHPKVDIVPTLYSWSPNSPTPVITNGTFAAEQSPDSRSPRIVAPELRQDVAHDFPPTPPSHSRESPDENLEVSKQRRRKRGNTDFSTSDSGPKTPMNQTTPPTPDNTPPRDLLGTPRLQTPPASRYASS